MSISLYNFQFKWDGWTWFNLSGPCFKIGTRPYFFWLWNAFNRVTNDDQYWWGFGLFITGGRALFYVGHSGISILFLGKTQ